MRVSLAARPRVARHLSSLVAILAAHRGVGAAPACPPRSQPPPRARTASTWPRSLPKRAVIVVGPVGSSSTKYKQKGEAIAVAAEAHGMEVTRIFTPNAVWSQVVAAANGADLFVYLGHGNGWPSPNPPFQEDTKDGLGLNPSLGARHHHDQVLRRQPAPGVDQARAERHRDPQQAVLRGGQRRAGHAHADHRHRPPARGQLRVGLPLDRRARRLRARLAARREHRERRSSTRRPRRWTTSS